METSYDIANLFAKIGADTKAFAESLQGMPQLYSHRNGETEPPSLPEKYFWYKATDPEDFGFEGVYFTQTEGCQEEDGVLDVDLDFTPYRNLPPGRWWGPVSPPWEQGDGTQ
jgi:hypothetical protein